MTTPVSTPATTLVFTNFEEFSKREDLTVNGVSPEFIRAHPDYQAENSSNTGCWNCAECTHCMECQLCDSCTNCTGCNSCEACTDCNYCNYSDNLVGKEDQHEESGLATTFPDLASRLS